MYNIHHGNVQNKGKGAAGNHKGFSPTSIVEGNTLDRIGVMCFLECNTSKGRTLLRESLIQ